MQGHRNREERHSDLILPWAGLWRLWSTRLEERACGEDEIQGLHNFEKNCGVLIRYVFQDVSLFDSEAWTLNCCSFFQRNLFSSWYSLLIPNPSAGDLALRNLSLQSGGIISTVVLAAEMRMSYMKCSSVSDAGTSCAETTMILSLLSSSEAGSLSKTANVVSSAFPVSPSLGPLC